MGSNIKVITNAVKTCSIIVIILITSFLLYALSNYIASSTFQPLDENSDNFSAQYSYLIDTDNIYNQKNINYQFDNFTKTTKNKIPYKLKEQTYWVRIKITKFSNNLDNIILHADNSILNTFKIFEIEHSAITSTLFDLESLHKNEIKKRVFPHVALDLSEKTSKEILLKIKPQGPPDVPIEYYLVENFTDRVELTLFIFGALIGIIVLMTLYNLVFYFAVKNKIYLFYIGYLLSTFFALSSINGFGYYLFSFDIQHLLNTYVATFHYAMAVFLLLFTLYFLNYEKDNTIHFKVSLYLISIFILCGLITIPLPSITEAQIFFLIFPAIVAYFIYLAVIKLRGSIEWSKYYFISWVPLFIGVTLQPLAHLNIIESNFLVSNAFLFVVIIEVIFLSFALAERMKKTEQDRLNDICYHYDSKLPRKGILEQSLLREINKDNGHKISVVVIKPEHIEKISLYINDYFNTQFFINLTDSINGLVQYNDAVLTITNKSEKIAFIEPYSLALLLNENTSTQNIEAFIESIQHKVNDSYKVKELNLPLFANVGVSSYPENSANPQVLINEAQLASNKAAESKSGWCIFENQNKTKDDYLLNLASHMSDAINNDEFEIYHQPQIDLRTLRVCGSECLIRWYYQGEGFISPLTFITIAEDIGLIRRLTQWVIKRSLHQHNMIMDNGYKNHMISINISGKDLNDPEFVHFIKQALEEANIPAEKVILELTESTAVTNSSICVETMQALVDLGIKMSIDDFGTGYSSMSYMSQLPCQELKVDREFVENIKDNPKNKVICETTVKMAKGLNLEVVAEGINSKSDENILRSFGCDIGQGFYYAKPMPIEHYLVWLAKEVNGQFPEDEIL